HSGRILTAHSISPTRMVGLENEALLPARSLSRTPRALEQAPQTLIGMPSATVVLSVSPNGGQPTGTTAAATGSRISDTASPRMKISTSCPASFNALACRKPKAALVGSSDPHALFTSMRLMLASERQRMEVWRRRVGVEPT